MTDFAFTNNEISNLFGWRKGCKLTLRVEEIECVDEKAQDDIANVYKEQGWTVIKARKVEGSDHFFLKVARKWTKPSKEYPLMTTKELLQKAYA